MKYVTSCGETYTAPDSMSGDPVLSILEKSTGTVVTFWLRYDLVGQIPKLSLDLLCLLGSQMGFIVVRCAWCSSVLRLKASQSGGGVTDGICAACEARYREELP